MILGFAGKAATGKTTAANHMAPLLDKECRIVPMAMVLRDEVEAFLRAVGADESVPLVYCAILGRHASRNLVAPLGPESICLLTQSVSNRFADLRGESDQLGLSSVAGNALASTTFSVVAGLVYAVSTVVFKSLTN